MAEMKFWPWLRESVLSCWFRLLEYDSKIPASKREKLRREREARKAARLEKDAKQAELKEIRQQVKAEMNHEREVRKAAAAQEMAKNKFYHWPGKGKFEFEIVGESFHKKVIAQFAGDHDENGAEAECIASLVPEDRNRHDPNAVAVKIEGQTVGYLSREDAPRYRKRLAKNGLSGKETTCDALIVGGGTWRNGKELDYGIRLDLTPFD